jgi:hypothetical protein
VYLSFDLPKLTLMYIMAAKHYIEHRNRTSLTSLVEQLLSNERHSAAPEERVVGVLAFLNE